MSDQSWHRFDIPLINEISGNNAEFSEAISNGDIELFSKEFEEVNENPRKLMRWMKNQVASAEKLRAEEKNLSQKYSKIIGRKDPGEMKKKSHGKMADI